jgi:hypothetical protein
MMAPVEFEPTTSRLLIVLIKNFAECCQVSITSLLQGERVQYGIDDVYHEQMTKTLKRLK